MTKTVAVWLGSATFALAAVGVVLWCLKLRDEATRPSAKVMLARMVEDDLRNIVEFALTYAAKHDSLPKRLEDMSSSGIDFADWYAGGTVCRRHYGYAVAENGIDFAASSVGQDGIPNTKDDIAIVHRGGLSSYVFGSTSNRALGISTECVPSLTSSE